MSDGPNPYRNDSRQEPEDVGSLGSTVRALRFVIVALMVGPVLFGVYVVTSWDGPWAFLGPERRDLTLSSLGFAILLVLLSIVVPPLFRKGIIELATTRQIVRSISDPRERAHRLVAARIQTATIMRLAFVEAIAFHHLFVVMFTGYLLHILVAVLALAYIAFQFPTRSAFERQLRVVLENASVDSPT